MQLIKQSHPQSHNQLYIKLVKGRRKGEKKLTLPRLFFLPSSLLSYFLFRFCSSRAKMWSTFCWETWHIMCSVLLYSCVIIYLFLLLHYALSTFFGFIAFTKICPLALNSQKQQQKQHWMKRISLLCMKNVFLERTSSKGACFCTRNNNKINYFPNKCYTYF